MIYIETLDGIKHDLSSYGIKPLKLEIESLSPVTVTEVIEGRDGHLDLGTTFEGRQLKAYFALIGKNSFDYYFARNAAFRLFNARSCFYLIDKREPYKRWKVKTSSSFTPSKINFRTSTFELALFSPSPYSESTSTTLNPSYTDGYLQLSTNEKVKYSFINQSTFRIWNEGDIVIDPCMLPLKIKFEGASNNLTIINHTTGDRWQYNGSTVEGDIVTLDGIRCYKNSEDNSIFGKTNLKLITLEKGFNQFEIIGTTSPFNISFDFRFYYI